MPARVPLLCFLAVLGLAGCQSPDGAGTRLVGRVTRITGEFPELVLGTTGPEIRAQLGAPAEISSAPSEAGNAEIWIYYLEKRAGKVEVVTYVNRAFPSGMFPNDAMAGVPEPVYRTADRNLLLTLRLLLVDNRLAAQTARVEEHLEF